MKINPLLLCDAYKLDHIRQYPVGTQYVYSNLTPRKSRIPGVDGMVFFGLQYFLIEVLEHRFDEDFFNQPKDAVLAQYERRVRTFLGQKEVKLDHIAALHDLGYLPVRIKALKEGTVCPMRVPCLTIVNTLPEFYWLTNFLETILSAEIWQACTSATIAHEYRKILDRHAEATGMPPDFVQWQGHDFSFRGMSSLESAILSGMGHLLSFTGSDTIPAIEGLEQYYRANADTELIGGSVPATEHSVACAGGKEGEYNTFHRLITEIYPRGIVSIVSDTWDLWKVLTEFLPALKQEILARDGKVVIRPDSGDPVKIICGIPIKDYTNDCKTLEDAKAWAQDDIEQRVRNQPPHGEAGEDSPDDLFRYEGKVYRMELEIYWNRYDKQYYYIDSVDLKTCEEHILSPEQKGVVELLWDVFGGTVTDKGFRLLDSHIGAIYGDSINLERADKICTQLAAKGFASQVVFGIGSFTYQYNTRDTFGTAMKATFVEVNDEGRAIFKSPVTDDGTKVSAKGLLKVEDKEGKLILVDQVTPEEEDSGLLELVWEDGKLVRCQSLADIRAILAEQR